MQGEGENAGRRSCGNYPDLAKRIHTVSTPNNTFAGCTKRLLTGRTGPSKTFIAREEKSDLASKLQRTG